MTGFLCLQILSHIDVEFSLFWKETHNTIHHELRASGFAFLLVLQEPYHAFPAPNALVQKVIRREEYKKSIRNNSSQID